MAEQVMPAWRLSAVSGANPDCAPAECLSDICHMMKFGRLPRGASGRQKPGLDTICRQNKPLFDGRTIQEGQPG
jgi:hypothetical protein